MIADFSPAHRGGRGTPLVCLHGFTDTWRTWELVLPTLKGRHDVLAPTLPGHAGGPALDGEPNEGTLADALEAMMDEAGIETAHVVGNSLGGYLALQLAERGRARSVIALAPAGGWAAGDDSFRDTLAYFTSTQELLKVAAVHADRIVASAEGRRQATLMVTERYEHLPPDLIAHQIRGAANCEAVGPLIEFAEREGWTLERERITCPVRIVWGTTDRLLKWPAATRRFREDWVPEADWVKLDGVGHCIQLDVPGETTELILEFTADADTPCSATPSKETE